MDPVAPSSSPASFPRPLPVKKRGTNLGFVALGLALLFCSSVGISVAGFAKAPPPPSLLEVPGIAFVDGVGLEAGTAVTHLHLIAPDVRSTFAEKERPCVFFHGEPVRVISEHEGALHAENSRCSAWVPSGWLSGTRRPALGLLK